LGLAACDKQGQPTVGQKLDSGVQQTERAETIAKGVKGVMSVTNNHKVAV
jgi:osmotically-inducible protein OsmY